MLDMDLETRREMEKFHDPQQAFNCWVERMAFAKKMTINQALNLAMVKEVGLQYTGEGI